jgi:hypothetical protein
MVFPKDWPAIEAILIASPTADDWTAAFEVCLKARIQSRYLTPINKLQNGPYQGEGFTILTIQCALIEFLAALKLGWNYRVGAQWGHNNEYGQSRRLFKDFLLSEAPFSTVVTSDADAQTFYNDIRCALVHETQTKDKWRIWAGSSTSLAIDFQSKIVNRDLFQILIDTYVDNYGNIFPTSSNLQHGFLMKFQNIFSHS